MVGILAKLVPMLMLLLVCLITFVIFVGMHRHALGMLIDMPIKKRAFPQQALSMPTKCTLGISSARHRNRHFEPWNIRHATLHVKDFS
jgi:hypothetical protein